MDVDVSRRVLTVPNALSLLRLLLVPVFAWLIVLGADGLAIALLMVSGITDYLDGFLARRWHQVTRVGQLLDPIADRLYILCTLLGLAYRDVVPWWLVVLLVARDVVLTLTVPVLYRTGHGPLEVHFLGKAATLNLLYAFPLLLLGDGAGTTAVVAEVAGWAFAWWGIGLYWWTALIYLRSVVLIVRAPRRPGPPAPGAGQRPEAGGRQPEAGGRRSATDARPDPRPAEDDAAAVQP